MRHTTAAATLSLILVVAGCAGGGKSGSTTGAVDRSTSTSSPDPTSAKATATAAGCGKPADAQPLADELPGDVAETISVDGTERNYRLGVPDTYDPDRPTPLVMNLHGSGSNAVEATVYSRLPQEAAKRGMLTVTPDAIDGKWQLAATGSDHEFLTALIQDIEARYCIDPARIYLSGMSLGAWKAAITGCTDSDTFAAVALVTVEVHPAKCPPLPVVAFHGTADAAVPYGEGSGATYPKSPNAGLPGTRENIANWAEGNGCDPEPASKRIGDDVERWTYRHCKADVVLYTVFGGGHTWPGANLEIGPTTQTIDATRIALDWFENHPKTG